MIRYFYLPLVMYEDNGEEKPIHLHQLHIEVRPVNIMELSDEEMTSDYWNKIGLFQHEWQLAYGEALNAAQIVVHIQE